MPQISKRKLDKNIEKEMFSQFWASLATLRGSSEVASFFSDLLTDTEEVMLAKRFMVAVLLLRGKRPVDIRPILHVTYSTIGSVASWLKHSSPKTQRVMERIIQEDSWKKLLDRIDSALDALPPAYGTNWQRAGKEKWIRTLDRQGREALR